MAIPGNRLHNGELLEEEIKICVKLSEGGISGVSVFGRDIVSRLAGRSAGKPLAEKGWQPSHCVVAAPLNSHQEHSRILPLLRTVLFFGMCMVIA